MSEVQPVAEATPAPVTIVETPTPSIEDTMAQVYEKHYPDSRVTRASDTGQFKSKEAAVEAAPEAEGAEVVGDAAEIVTDQKPDEVKSEPEKPAIARPQSWSSDLDEFWASLPPERQEFLLKRESETHKKISELGQAVKATEHVKPQLEQLERVAQSNGIAPGEAIQRFLAADDFLKRDPVAAIQWLAQSYRVDLSRLVHPQIGGDTPESANINALHQEISQLKQQLYGVTNQITAREQAEMQAREQSLTQSIEKFAEGKDYWSDIENEVVAQVHAIKLANPGKEPMEVLKEAHDRAIKLTPSVQEKLDKSAKEEAAKKAQAEAKKKADEAKRQASLNVKSSTGSTPKSTSKDMYSEMSDIYDRIAAAG